MRLTAIQKMRMTSGCRRHGLMTFHGSTLICTRYGQRQATSQRSLQQAKDLPGALLQCQLAAQPLHQLLTGAYSA